MRPLERQDLPRREAPGEWLQGGAFAPSEQQPGILPMLPVKCSIPSTSFREGRQRHGKFSSGMISHPQSFCAFPVSTLMCCVIKMLENFG